MGSAAERCRTSLARVPIERTRADGGVGSLLHGTPIRRRTSFRHAVVEEERGRVGVPVYVQRHRGCVPAGVAAYGAFRIVQAGRAIGH